VSFSLQDNQALLEASREAAFADARAKAEQSAVLAGRQLGAVVSISEVSAQPSPPVPFAAEAAADGAAGRLSIAPGQQEVDVQVTVVWELA